MTLLRSTVLTLGQAALLIIGILIAGFLLMVYFGPDPTLSLLSKNPTDEEIANLQSALGQNLPVWQQFLNFSAEIVRLDFGHSITYGKQVSTMLAEAAPITIKLVLPGFILGNGLALTLAMMATAWRNSWIDRLFLFVSIALMSLSFVVIVMGFQALVYSQSWLNWFPIFGWKDQNMLEYFRHVTIPTLSLAVVSLAYNARFFRALMIEEYRKPYVLTSRAYGTSRIQLFSRDILKNTAVPISTRLLFSLPAIALGGSLLIEKQFGIPGLGRLIYESAANGDQPVLKAVLALSSLVFAALLLLADRMYAWIDPRTGGAA